MFSGVSTDDSTTQSSFLPSVHKAGKPRSSFRLLVPCKKAMYAPPNRSHLMSYASNTAAVRGAYQTPPSGGMASSMAANMRGTQYTPPSGGMGDALAANLDYRQYQAPSGNMASSLANNFSRYQYRVGGKVRPTSMEDILGPDGLWYSPTVSPSGQADATAAPVAPTAPTVPGPSTAAVVGDALHQAAGVVTDIINQGSATQRQQLLDATNIRIAEIQAQAGQDPNTIAQNAAMLAALQQAQAATAAALARQAPAVAQPLNTNFLIGAGLAVVVVIGGIAFMMSSRKNPSCGPGCACEKCRNNPVIGSGRNRQFVPMHELERRARKRARRRAAK